MSLICFLLINLLVNEFIHILFSTVGNNRISDDGWPHVLGNFNLWSRGEYHVQLVLHTADKIEEFPFIFPGAAFVQPINDEQDPVINLAYDVSEQLFPSFGVRCLFIFAVAMLIELFCRFGKFASIVPRELTAQATDNVFVGRPASLAICGTCVAIIEHSSCLFERILFKVGDYAATMSEW